MLSEDSRFVKLDYDVLTMNVPAGAKILFAILVDRIGFSQYEDELGQYYFLSSNEKDDLMTLVPCKKDSFQKYMSILRKNGLIQTMQHGKGNRVYLVPRSRKKSMTKTEVMEKIVGRSRKKSMTKDMEKIHDPTNKTNVNQTKQNQTVSIRQSSNITSAVSISEAGHEKMYPSFTDVLVYWKEKNYHSSPADFTAYYQARDWMINGKPVRSWKRLADSWEKREF